MEAGKPRDLRQLNRKTVLDLFRKADILTAADISGATGISKTTVMKILAHLLDRRIILEAGKGESGEEGGKRPNNFELNGNAARAVALHLFPDSIGGIVTDTKNAILDSRSAPIEDGDNPALVAKKARAMIHDLIAGSGGIPLAGVALALPGIVDPDRGILRYAPRFSAWGCDIPVTALLGEGIGDVPVYVDNESRFQVMAEKYAGAAGGRSNIIAIEAGEGLAAGIMTDGEIVRGVHNLAGEIGHMVLSPGGDEPCVCGGTGCFEVMVSSRRLAKRVKEWSPAHPDSPLAQSSALRDQDLVNAIVSAAAAGDRLGARIFDELVDWFSIGLSNLIVTHDPDIIVLQGAYARAGGFFMTRLREKVGGRVLVGLVKDVEIASSELGRNAGMIGAAHHINNEYYRRLMA
jgi:N-acetylglucosamine repressor